MLGTPADTFPMELNPIPKVFFPKSGTYIGKVHNHGAEVILVASVVALPGELELPDGTLAPGCKVTWEPASRFR